MLNKLIMSGRLVKDPEIKQTANGSTVATFVIANEYWMGEKRTQYPYCVAYNGTAEAIGKYYHKGDGIDIVGKLIIRNYEDKEGNKKSITEINIESVEFPLSSKTNQDAPKSGDNSASVVLPTNSVPSQKTASSYEFETIPVTDDDIPF